MTDHELLYERSSYSDDAIQRAIYRLSDRLSGDVRSDGNLWRCTLHLFEPDPDRADITLHEFRNEVLDQVLRERIRRQTELTRNLILSLAFSQTGLPDSEDAG
jgi:His-Xaa-Ser system protein HxsD